MKTLAATIALGIFWVPTSTALATVVFAQSGDDLTVSITQPIVLTATATLSSPLFGIVFEDVYSSPVTLSAGFAPDEPPTSTMSFNGNTSTLYDVSGQRTPGFGEVDSTDFLIYYEFVPLAALNAGDIVTVSPGTITLSGYFNAAQSELPDVPVQTAQLINIVGGAMSDPVAIAAVPEPSGFAFVLLGCTAAWVRRRRHTT